MVAVELIVKNPLGSAADSEISAAANASAICMGVASSDAATALSLVDCSGDNPPSGKYGT
jgi:hypothetical protein